MVIVADDSLRAVSAVDELIAVDAQIIRKPGLWAWGPPLNNVSDKISKKIFLYPPFFEIIIPIGSLCLK